MCGHKSEQPGCIPVTKFGPELSVALLRMRSTLLGVAERIRAAAMEIVLREEAEKGWKAQAVRSVTEEKRHGCDILSIPPAGGEPHPVEVKGWSEPFLSPTGLLRHHQDLRASQFKAAHARDDYRIEVVANLAAYLAGQEPYQRLTLRANQIRQALPSAYELPLAELAREIRNGPRPAASQVGGGSPL